MKPIMYGTIVVGTLDAIDAIVVFGLRGSTPIRVFQGIASGWLGRASFEGGLRTALLGVATHFFIAFAIVAAYYATSRKIGILRRRPLVFGAMYGVAVYFFMNLVVIPLSAIGAVRFSAPLFVNGILIHVFGIGIPSALFAARGENL